MELNGFSQLLTLNQRWLVTGVAGFIGSHLLESLLLADQHVVGLDNFSTGRKENLELVKQIVSPAQWSRFEMIQADVRDSDVCRQAVGGVDCVLHQAALGSVPRSISDPVTTNEVNISGTLNLMWAAKESGIRSFVYASSSAVYGDHPGLPKIESEIGQPLSPYAITKLVNEQYARVFYSNYGFASIGLRYFNVFGPRQDPNGAYAAVVPKWYAAMLANDAVRIHGDGETSRDFCFVRNVVQANLLAAAACSTAADIYNIAIGQRTTLNSLFQLIKDSLAAQSFNYDQTPIHDEFRPGDVRHSLADISHATRQLGYQPSHTVEQGLAETVSWYTEKNRLPNSQVTSAI